ncbi:MAG: porin family protein [Crocinitomicaceae bacterium]
MKKNRLVTSIICVFILTNLQAQSEDRRENFEFGIKAGVNASNVWDAQGENFRADGKAGLAAGVFFGIPIGKYLGVQPEVLISQKGFKGSGTLLSFPYSFSRTSTYLDIPLQMQLKPTEFFTLLAGPQFSYLLNQKSSYTFGGISTGQEEQFNTDNIRKNVLGFVVGSDFIYHSLVVSARAGWDFQNNNGDGTNSTPRYKNRWVQLTLGFKI